MAAVKGLLAPWTCSLLVCRRFPRCLPRVVQVRKQEPRQLRCLGQGHAAAKWQR